MEPTNLTHTAEEEAANRAAAELQRGKRHRKRLHRILFLLIVLLVAGGGYGYYRYQQAQAALAEAEADVLALADGEELVYGEITEIVGNDITVAVVTQDAASSDAEVNAKAPASEGPAMPASDGDDNIDMSTPPSMPSGASMTQQTTYTQTGETKEYQIPVGTDVTSSLGSTTTFAKLRSGDVIGIVTQAGTDNILRIKIVQ